MIKTGIKKMLNMIDPAYRVSLRIERQNELIFKRFKDIEARINRLDRKYEEIFWLYLL